MSSLINVAACKKFAKERAPILRSAWKMTQVSKEFVDQLNFAVERMIDSKIRNHPTHGQTLTWET